MRGKVPRFQSDAREVNRRLVDLLRGIGERHGASPAQVALAWLLAQKAWVVPLFGTRKLERFDENIGSLDVRLTDADLRELNESRTTMPVEGARYTEENMRRVGL
jgi:aryl-alcohol dehydrogenase-like predicted oxidoreductase